METAPSNNNKDCKPTQSPPNPGHYPLTFTSALCLYYVQIYMTAEHFSLATYDKTSWQHVM